MQARDVSQRLSKDAGQAETDLMYVTIVQKRRVGMVISHRSPKHDKKLFSHVYNLVVRR